MSGRKRIRGGIPDAAPLSRGSAAFGVGGSGNVAALDTLRAMAKQPETLQVFFDELKRASGVDGHFDQAVRDLQVAFGDFDDIEYRARKIVGDMALALQASLLLRYGHPAVADAFCASRLGNSWGECVRNAARGGVDVAPILERATVKIGA